MRYTTKSFIQKAKEIHNQKYDYSLVEYKSIKDKVKFICNSCKSVKEQTPDNHLSGYDCCSCYIENKGVRLSYESICSRLNLIFNGQYSIIDTNDYKNTHSLIKIKSECCNKIFFRKAYLLLQGQKPCKCRKESKVSLKPTKPIPEHLQHFELISYNPKDYRCVFNCSSHGEFSINFYHFIKSKYGCPKCGREGSKVPYEQVLNRCVQKHKDRYIYGNLFKSTYKGVDEKASITCTLHGVFEQVVRLHYEGANCPECVREHKLIPLQQRILQLNKVHNNKYIYDSVFKKSFSNRKGEVSILCPIHGRFSQIFNNHLKGSGCPECAKELTVSKPEKELRDWLLTEFPSFTYIYNYRPNWLLLPNSLKPSEIDIFICELGLAIEYNGTPWHSTKHKYTYYHKDKFDLCLQNNVNLIHIFDFENIDDWKQNLRNYFYDFHLYSIKFNNTLREYNGLQFYGHSLITT